MVSDPNAARNTSGTRTEPSGCWYVSRIAATTAGQREARPVERVDELRLRARLGPVADRHPPRLVVAEVRARADLQPALHARRPDLEVVLLRLDEAHLAGAHQQDAIGEPEALEEDLGALGHPLERRRRVLRLLEQHHLDLVELVDAEDAAGVLAGRAGLAPEARRVRRVVDRQVGRLEDLVAVEVRDRDLGGGDQVQVVAGDDVHLVFLVRDLAGAARRRGVHDRGRPDLGEAVLGGVDVEEPVDERRAAAREPAPL